MKGVITMEKYEPLACEVIELDAVDVIAASDGKDGDTGMQGLDNLTGGQN